MTVKIEGNKVYVYNKEGELIASGTMIDASIPSDDTPVLYRACDNADCGVVGTDRVCQACGGTTHEVEYVDCICGEFHPISGLIDHILTSPQHHGDDDELYQQYGVTEE